MRPEEIENSTLPAHPPVSESESDNLSNNGLDRLNELLFMTHRIIRIRSQIEELESQPEKNKDAIERQKRVLRQYGEVYKKILEPRSAMRLGAIIAEREFLISINKLQEAKKLSDEMRELLSGACNKLQDAQMREALVKVLNDAIHELSDILSISEEILKIGKLIEKLESQPIVDTDRIEELELAFSKLRELRDQKWEEFLLEKNPEYFKKLCEIDPDSFENMRLDNELSEA